VSEFGPSDGILFRYTYADYAEIVSACVASITADPTRNDKAYVMVKNTAIENLATTAFTNAGADMSKVEFIHAPTNSIWLGDYGPGFILQNGAMAVVNSLYMDFRPLDGFVPTLIGADHMQIPVIPMGLERSARANFLVGSNGVAFTTDFVEYSNPQYSLQEIVDEFDKYLGVHTLHVFPRLPWGVDASGCLEMWMNLVDDHNVVISQFAPGSDPTAIAITDAAAIYMANLGFNVFRVPDSVDLHPSSGWTHFTYTCGFRINDRLYITKYGDSDPSRIADDQTALAAYQAAAPACQIIQIDCYDIIGAVGALHSITMNVPRRDDAAPAAWLKSPNGGELLVSGTAHEIEWSAMDDVAVTGIDLRYSLDGGSTFPNLIASGIADDGRELWTIPTFPTVEDRVVMKIVAHDANGNRGREWSDSYFTIRSANQRVYDFSSNPGIDKWGWGVVTGSWGSVDGVRHPAALSQEIDTVDPLAYSKIAVSDATGGDSDANRYIPPPLAYGDESTHIFEFDIIEDPSTILDIELRWEGYSDDCQQTELYVWNAAGQNWGDCAGALGRNKYVADSSGNRDAVLKGNIRGNFADFIENNGRLTLLVYTDFRQLKAFHDYVSVTITRDGP